MESIELILATYIDVNLLLSGTALVWLAARKLMLRYDFRTAFTSQFVLLKMLVLCSLALPVLLTLSAQVFSSARTVPANLSDLVLSQFLQGNLQLNPGLLEQVLSMRQNLTSQIASPNHPLVSMLVAGILLTATFMAARAVLTGFKLRRILGSAHKWRSFGRLHLLLSDTIHVPFSTRTLRNRYIVLPSGMLARRTDKKVALAHELQHLRESDVDWEMAVALLTPLFFWNPAFHYFRRQIEELRELSCDQKVLSRGLFNAEDYCQCLLRVCANRFRRPQLFQLRMPEVALIETRIGLFDRSNRPARLLASRLTSAVEGGNGKQSLLKVTLVATLLVLATGTLSFVIQKPHDWSQDRLMLSTIINLDRLEQRNRIGLGTVRY